MLYPIDEQISALLESVYDPETGELLEGITEEDLQNQIADLQLDFDEKIKSLRNAYLTVSHDAECIAAEASALYKIQQQVSKQARATENRAERIRRFIAYLLQGQKWQKDGCKVSYTTRDTTVLDDDFVEWAYNYAPQYLKMEPRKADVTAALKAGKELNCAHLEKKTYINIK